MKLHLDSNIQNFLSETKTHLESKPEIHSFLLGLAHRSHQTKKPAALLARMTDKNKNLLAAGLQTDPDRVLILSQIPEDESRKFAQLLAEKVDQLPGVHGAIPAVDAFAEEWSARKKVRTHLCSNMRLFELNTLVEPQKPNGFGRAAKALDQKLIFDWLRAFQAEAVPNDPPISDEDLSKSIDEGITKEQYFIWEDKGQAVCLVGSRRETELHRWIAPVYTPSQSRGQGYGSALTAFASQKILESGKKGMLFTDLANPISNSIYQKIGYEALADFKHFTFC